MGIPKFYRWLSERYPLVNQPGGTTVIPIIDNFYLDMNGIIHNCTHGNNPDVKLTEDEMMLKIFTYLDKLFHIVKPQKLIFMAIDGVAPRAKMNQQRSRRFKSAQAAGEAAEAAVRRGEMVPEDRFDSNCITPGTAFMGRLGAHLRFFIRKKIAEDKDWQKPKVIFSGHDVPGEGEHKIMEYIRWQKLEPGYPPNIRHCLYGLDADLVMLSLVTHEPHFCLLREVVSFTGGSRGQPAREVLDNPCQEHFVLLQIGLLRDYFELEFRSTDLPFKFDMERVIDDFVLFCMLVGNDFLPALPTLDIAEGALDKMFTMYRRMLPQLGGYLTHAGKLDRGRLELFLSYLAQDEADVLQSRAEDAEQFEAKRSRREGASQPAWASARVEAKRSTGQQGRNELDEDDAFEAQMAGLLLTEGKGDLELLGEVEGLEDDGPPADPIISEPTMMGQQARSMFLNGDKQMGLASWKARYYREKMGLRTEAERRKVVESYIEGLHWVLEYYYRGVASWDWYYPYHYAPMASDLVDLASVPVQFHLGTPFLPFQQLLAVLPAASAKLLPDPFQTLMKDPNSPIVDFYPTTFRVDLEGKRADWEGIVLIPFLEEQRLLRASELVKPQQLTAEERARNKLGDILVFSHDPDSEETSFCQSTMPGQHTSVTKSCSRLVAKPAPPPLPADKKGFQPKIVEGTTQGMTGPPGFPSLKTLKLGGEVRRAGVNVFGRPSAKESLIVQLKEVPGQQPTAAQVAGAVLGNRCWIKWPYLAEGVVEAVSDAQTKGPVAHTSAEASTWQEDKQRLVNDYLIKQGVETGPVLLLLHVRPCEGLIRQADGAIAKRFGKQELLVPIQMVLRRNPSPDPRFQPDAVAAELSGIEWQQGSQGLYLGRAHYGCMATVLPPLAAGMTRKGQQLEAVQPKGGPVRVSIDPASTNSAAVAASAKRILGNMKATFVPSGQVARRLGVSYRTLGRMTGNVWLELGKDKVDVGLCVKNAGKGLFVPDFATPLGDGDNKGWAYSEELIRSLQQYKQRYSWLWVAVEAESATHSFQIEQVLPGVHPDAAMQQVSELRKWLRGQPIARRPMVKFSAQVAPEVAVKMLQAAQPPRPKLPPPTELENVATALLLPPTQRGGVTVALAGGSFEIGDRVAALSGTGAPPFGLRGTVVGIIDDAIEVLFDMEFSGGTDLYGRCHGNCGMLLPTSELLNLSKPHAVKAEGAHAVRAVRQQGQAQHQSSAGTASGNPAGSAGAMSAKQALQAAAAALSGPPPSALGTNGIPRPAALASPIKQQGQNGAASRASAAVKTTAISGSGPPKVVQPKIPDENGGRGFGLGRGRGAPTLAGVPAQHAKAPGAPAGPPSNAGVHLLAKLQSKELPAAQHAHTQAASPLRPSTNMPPQSPQQQSLVAPPSPGQALLSQLQSPQQRTMAAAPAPPGLASGSALLQQLQQAAVPPTQQGGPAAQHRNPPAPPRSQSSANALLSALQFSPAKPRPPTGGARPPSPLPGATSAHAGAGRELAGAASAHAGAGQALLQQLHGGNNALGYSSSTPAARANVRLGGGPGPAPGAALPPASGAATDLSGVWMQLQQQHDVAEAAAAAAPVPPPPSALLMGFAGEGSGGGGRAGGGSAQGVMGAGRNGQALKEDAEGPTDEAAFWDMLKGASLQR